jgi:hypothetical protein
MSKENDQGETKLLALHAALVSQRGALNGMMWQVPAMCFTAQAFLLQAAFNVKDVTDGYRILSGLLSTLVGLLCWQVFLRHSALEIQTSKRLQDLEKENFPLVVHQKPEDAPHYNAHGVGSCESRPFWCGGLLVMSFVGLFPIFENVWFCGK